MEILFTILVIILIYQGTRLRNTRKRLKVLEERVKRLDGAQARLSRRQLQDTPQKEAGKKAAQDPIPKQEILEKRQPVGVSDQKKSSDPSRISRPVSPQSRRRRTPPPPPKKKAPSLFWQDIERRFAENWIGVLGAIALVLGLGFLGIYAAFKMAAFYRFLMLVAASGILLGGYFLLRKNKLYARIGGYLRSSAGAVFLFACLGSGGLEGLQWIYDPLMGFALLMLGVATNLGLGYWGGREENAALHIVISLVAVSAAMLDGPPDSLIAYSAGTLVALYGVVLAFRQKWELHLLSMLVSFFLFHLVWYLHATGLADTALSKTQHLAGIISTLSVGSFAVLIYYRKAYAHTKALSLPYFIHLGNWTLILLSLLPHSTGSRLKSIFILLGAAGVMMLARRARKLGIQWMYRMDTVVAQLIAVGGILSFERWELSPLVISAFLFAESVLFMYLMWREKSPGIFRFGGALLHVSLLAVMGSSLYLGQDPASLSAPDASLFIAILVAAMGVYLFLHRIHNQQPEYFDFVFGIDTDLKGFSLFGFLVPFLTPILYHHLPNATWSMYAVVILLGGIFLLESRLPSIALKIGMTASLGVLHLMAWYQLFGAGAGSGAFFDMVMEDLPGIGLGNTGFAKLVYGLPLLLLDIYLVLRKAPIGFKRIGLYAAALHLGMLIWLIFNPVSSLIPGVAWLLLVPVCLEGAAWFHQKKKDDFHLATLAPDFIVFAFAFLTAFILRHLSVHLLEGAYLWIFPVKAWIALLGLGIMAWWASFKMPVPDPVSRLWQKSHPLFLELSILWLIFIVGSETNSAYWQPIIWVAMAAACLWAGNRWSPGLSRLRFYALLFSWATAFQVAFISSSEVRPSTSFVEEAWFTAVIALVLLSGFLYFFYKRGGLEELYFPPGLGRIHRFSEKVSLKRNYWLLYPALFSAAIFLFWAFDKHILTLLWVIECFVVFSLSIILRDQFFRYTAMICVSICMIRLPFFDLQHADTLERALSFMGVGVLLLGMNYIYQRYKNRFEEEKEEVSTEKE